MRHGNVYLLNAKCNPGRHRAETHHSLAEHADKADIRTFMSRQRASVSGAQGHPGTCICFLVVNTHVCKLANRFFQQSTPELAQVQGLGISHATNGYSRHSCKWAWIGPPFMKQTHKCLQRTPGNTSIHETQPSLLALSGPTSSFRKTCQFPNFPECRQADHANNYPVQKPFEETTTHATRNDHKTDESSSFPARGTRW
ncbi:hypothetical protein KC19_9G147300 [Ceratodon purpureus]|uniref:Uncharacterized protein n=1 Tax=Ceratodon purpureus TaxID=3225 RepID=A0A8T0GVU4_CERPU|nr:hypothetical protein KC19_9G147300 [Ceratodon purpureus]